MKLINDLKWRYAVKKFDKSKTVSEEDINNILEAGNLTPTSFGLQAYRLVLVRDKKIITKLAECSYGEQLRGASHVIVLARLKNLEPKYIEAYLDLLATQRKLPKDKLEKYKYVFDVFIKNLDNRGQKESWMANQVYIVLGTLMIACAQARVDACPMEGIDKAKYDEVLKLKDKNLTTIVALPIGYRSEDDYYQEYTKMRIPISDMVVEL